MERVGRELLREKTPPLGVRREAKLQISFLSVARFLGWA
jgi:hypothetical protein